MTHKDEHLKLLAMAFCENMERHNDCEYGSLGLDCKRPFGNSYVQGDILEICKIKPNGKEDGDDVYSAEQERYADDLYNELPEYFSVKIKPLIAKL